MKSLRGLSMKLICSSDNGGDKGVLFRDKIVFGRPDTCCFKYELNKNVVNAALNSLRNETIIVRPVFCSSVSSEPESKEEFQDADAQTQETYQSKTVHVKLQLQRECLFGERFLIVGGDQMFGFWDPSDAIPMNWSDEHLWTVELDLPIEKSINFKFILKGNTEQTFWQPGPDRILRTWETDKTITILEDWHNADLQKITEEEPMQDKNEVSIVNSDILINNDNFNLPNEHPMDDIKRKSENIVGNNSKAIDTSNLASSLNHQFLVNGEDVPVLVPGLAQSETEEATDISNLASSLNVNHEDGPVLVPGLAQLETEEATTYQNDRSVSMDDIARTDVKIENASEFIERQGGAYNLHREENGTILFKEEDLSNVVLQINQELARVKERLRSDMKRGRETLQKLLLNLGIVLHR